MMAYFYKIKYVGMQQYCSHKAYYTCQHPTYATYIPIYPTPNNEMV